MYSIKQGIIEAAQLIGYQIGELNSESIVGFRNLVEQKFANQGSSFLWSRFREHASIYDPEGWKKISHFIGQQPILLFFDVIEEPSIFLIEGGDTLQKILAECPNFEFYVSDNACTFVLCHNHHDYLIGTGSAHEWIISSRESA